MDPSGVSSLLQFLPSFLSLMKGMNNSGQKATAAQLSNVTNAMTNPSNPLYQQMYGQYKQLGQQQLGDSISQMQGINRMQSAMGRTPLFSPERRGEAEFRTQASLAPQIGVMAGQETQQSLQNAAKALNPYGQSNTYQNLTKSQYGPQADFGSNNQLATGLAGLGKFISSGNQRSVQPMQQPSQQLPWQNGGLNAPGAQQGNSLAHILFGI